MQTSRWVVFVSLVGAVLVVAAGASADPRPFTFTYDTYPEGKGQVEYEQWLTYSTHKDEDHGFDRFDLRHEFEIGVAENFDFSVYLANWRYEDSAERKGTQFDSVSAEGILYLSNPVTDPLGLGLYGEVGIGEHEMSFEGKLLVHKDIGQWTIAYNLVLETEVEGLFRSRGGESEVEGELAHTFGLAYSLNPEWRVGGELVVESVYENWSRFEGTSVYAGPVVSYQGGKIGKDSEWWITVTPMFQLSSEADEPDFQVRMIAGIVF